jgi:branched-chain amino acid aminotransferase
LLHIPVPVAYEAFEIACFSLANALARPDSDLYIRATLYVVQGHYGEGTAADLVLTGYQLEKKPPAPIEMGVTTWRRAVDTVMSPRIKTGANYQSARLARIEGRTRGYEDMIFLNQWDRVAESSAACVLLVRGGQVLTPPSWEGALESITADMLAEIAGSLGIDFVRRPIDRTELYVGDELGLTGTLTEITVVRALDGYEYADPPPVLSRLLERYRDALLGIEPHPAVDLVTIPLDSR